MTTRGASLSSSLFLEFPGYLSFPDQGPLSLAILTCPLPQEASPEHPVLPTHSSRSQVPYCHTQTRLIHPTGIWGVAAVSPPPNRNKAT